MATTPSSERPTWRDNDSSLNSRAIFALVLGVFVVTGCVILQQVFGGH